MFSDLSAFARCLSSFRLATTAATAPQISITPRRASSGKIGACLWRFSVIQSSISNIATPDRFIVVSSTRSYVPQFSMPCFAIVRFSSVPNVAKELKRAVACTQKTYVFLPPFRMHLKSRYTKSHHHTRRPICNFRCSPDRLGHRSSGLTKRTLLSKYIVQIMPSCYA